MQTVQATAHRPALTRQQRAAHSWYARLACMTPGMKAARTKRLKAQRLARELEGARGARRAVRAR